MHISQLAIESPSVYSVVTMIIAVLFGWAVQHNYLPKSMSYVAVGLAVVSIYFGLLAASAGPAPRISRADMTVVLRYMLLVSAACLVSGGIALVFEIHRTQVSAHAVRAVLLVMVAALLAG